MIGTKFLSTIPNEILFHCILQYELILLYFQLAEFKYYNYYIYIYTKYLRNNQGNTFFLFSKNSKYEIASQCYPKYLSDKYRYVGIPFASTAFDK